MTGVQNTMEECKCKKCLEEPAISRSFTVANFYNPNLEDSRDEDSSDDECITLADCYACSD